MPSFLRGELPRAYLSVCLFGLLTLVCLSVQAQFFVADGAPCPGGNDVKLDTIMYTPDKAMPFDRCFYLRVTQPGKRAVKYFAVTPINKEGGRKVRRRDYRVYLRSTYSTWSQRLQARSSTDTYKDFKRLPFKRIFSGVSVVQKGNNTEIVLRVPPLDPGREYRIYLLSDESKAFNDVMNISELLIRSQQVLEAPMVPRAMVLAFNAVLITQAKQLHVRSVASSASKRPLPTFNRGSFSDYAPQLTSFALKFNMNERNIESYRIFYTPSARAIPNVSAAQAVPDIQSVLLQVPPNLQTQTVKLPIIDSEGNPINPFQIGKYSVQLLTIYKDSTSPSLTTLGDLSISSDGLTYSFTKNTTIADRVFVEFTDSPLSKIRTIKSETAKINGQTALQSGCFRKDALEVLLNQAIACPCEKEGIKDLTQKNELTRAISVLSENNNFLIKYIMLGQTSLDAPALDTIPISQYSTRLSNLQTSRTQINNLIEFARKVMVSQSGQAPIISNLITCLGTMQDQLRVNAESLEAIIAARTTLQDQFRDTFGLLEAAPLTMGSTTQLDLVSDAQLTIMPDFGFVALIKGDRQKPFAFQDFTPYLGFQVGFRPMDKNIPLRMIRYKSWRHRVSFMSGVTLRSLKIENQREDFFSGSSLITGLGFRLTNYLRLTSGVVWFKATDPNPLTSNKPLRFLPYVGVSIDLDVQKLFGGIVKLFQ